MPSNSYNCIGVVLAAGRSERMGSEDKLVLPLADGRFIIEHVLSNVKSSNLSTVKILVSNPAVAQHINREMILRPDHFAEQSSSVRAALDIAGDLSASHLMILLGDMPFVLDQDINAVLAKSRDAPESIIFAAHKKKRGNPCIIPLSGVSHWIEYLHSDQGAWFAINKAKLPITLVECSAGVLTDIDTREDLAKFL